MKKRIKNVRYVYATTAALLLTGGAITLSSGQPAGAQLLNEEGALAPAAAPAGAPGSFANLVDRLQPAVVNISTTQRVVRNANPMEEMFGRFMGNGGGGAPQIQEGGSLGTGFLVSGDGYIVTNNHVVAPAARNATVRSIKVTTSDHTTYEAELVGRDEASDLAVLKIKDSKQFPYVKFGSSKNSRVGDWVLAIGQPLGLEGTVTSGIISNIARTTGSGSAYDRFIQTDASINSGNSGGPMFDLTGNVIGVNTWIASTTGGNIGLGFAIPGEIARPIVEKLMKREKITRGYLGVGYAPLNDKLASALGVNKNQGVFVNDVAGDSPAAQAGIQARDVILSVAGKNVDLDNPLSVIIGNLEIGRKVPVVVIRDGKKREFNVALIERPTDKALAGSFGQEEEQGQVMPDPQFSQKLENENAIGLALLDLNPAIRRRLGVGEDVRAVVINGLNRQSDAAIIGLQRGDLILEVDGKKTATVAEVDAALSASKRAGKTAVLLLVARPGQSTAYVPVEFITSTG